MILKNISIESRDFTQLDYMDKTNIIRIFKKFVTNRDSLYKLKQEYVDRSIRVFREIFEEYVTDYRFELLLKEPNYNLCYNFKILGFLLMRNYYENINSFMLVFRTSVKYEKCNEFLQLIIIYLDQLSFDKKEIYFTFLHKERDRCIIKEFSNHNCIIVESNNEDFLADALITDELQDYTNNIDDYVQVVINKSQVQVD